MKTNIVRKCKACKNEIEINRNKIHDVIYYKNFYYHSSCFCELAKKRSQSKSRSASEWGNALNCIKELEENAKNILTERISKKDISDNLNEYLISMYDVVSIDPRFWQTLSDLNNGFYRGKRCKNVATDVICDTWKWMQNKLDDIDRYNKSKNKGPSNGKQRLNYDLTIVVKNIPEYLSYKAKQEAAEIERQMNKEETSNIDYSKIRASNKNDGLDDISSLLDDLI